MKKIKETMALFSQKAQEVTGAVKEVLTTQHTEIDGSNRVTTPNNGANGVKQGESSSLLTGATSSNPKKGYGGVN